MADVYRCSGRGGAGNFYSQKDIDEVMKGKPEDLEAQKPQHIPDDEPLGDPADVPTQTTPPFTNTTAGNGARAYIRSGRGGAGNFVDVPPSISPATLNPTIALDMSTVPAPSSPTSFFNTPDPQTYAQTVQHPARSGPSGRGGAGNWVSTDSDMEYDPEQERKRREALDAHILQDIRESLPQPPKIHYMHGPGRGRKPDSPSS
ncbi:uncharacterized protein GGS22DRAFT_167605 [Annulohypoxylon maeteangense]|uniref:uncharacterized protein n=1 Tax=Annulohypoxylon maeteangense TaxID=1927788 RepID=UPI0020076B40|nr:uncharacterized protein GGS22DRAFT_167605 [Annulohypoxylon maeteangense]KAI0883646.1 hypothetical protein GGS22DRAFT_167605 [Annulohypoxylon maeteangense]